MLEKIKHFFRGKNGDGDDITITKHRKYIKYLWILTGLFILSIPLIFIITSFTKLPSFEELENPKYDQATQVFANDGSVIGKYYIENRVTVTYEDLSPHLINALLSTEDERYYKHSGIDMKGLARAVARFGKDGGASTITQQLAKLLFTGTASKNIVQRIFQKFKEWIIAVRLEKNYTKEEIIAMYLNKFSFLYGAYGIRAASEIYFNETPDNLSLEQSAMLVGMLKNPARYNPLRAPKRALKRREVVLHQMKKKEYISQMQYDSLRVLPLDMSSFHKESHTTGLAPYFRMELRKHLKHVLKNVADKKSDGKPYDIYRDGLKVYTTIDPIIQKHHEEAMLIHMKKLQKFFNKEWKKDDPWEYRIPPNPNDPEDLGTTDEEMVIREKVLDRLIRSTDRAKAIRKKYFSDLTKQIKKDYEIPLRDIDILRLLNADKDKGYLKKLRKKKLISKNFEKKYNTLLKSKDWKIVKNQWRTFKKTLEESFAKKTQMKVFTYDNESLEKDTLMTPMDSLKYHRNFLQVGSMSVDPVTGEIKSWVGGINHKYFKYDHVTSNRQVGSTFKPLIYSTAIAQLGMSPCFVVDDIPYTIHAGEGNFHLKKDWTPNNANNEYSGEPFTLFKGLQYSKNTVSVYLMKQLGDPESVRELASNMGIPKEKVPPSPSICLGSAELAVTEMTGAYTSFANNGTSTKPIFLTKIVDKYDRVIYTEYPDNKPALEPRVNYVMIQMLKKVMHQGLPGFDKIKSEIGGKTGTTNSSVDGWFMGLTPRLVCGTWVGGEEQWIRFKSLRHGSGAKMARPIFAKLLQSLEDDEELKFDTKVRFPIPKGDIGIELDCEIYQQENGDTDFDETIEGMDPDQFGDEIEQDSTDQETSDEEDDFGEEL